MYDPGRGPFVDPNSNIYRNYQRKGEKNNVSPSDGAPYRRRFVLNPLVLAGIALAIMVISAYFLHR